MTGSSEGASMSHKCHWPGCNITVPPKLFACKPHWYALPAHLRAKIWRTYVPGQEVTKNPSQDYIDAALEVRAWILAREAAPTLRA